VRVGELGPRVRGVAALTCGALLGTPPRRHVIVTWLSVHGRWNAACRRHAECVAS
jgi:hypothetical protein